MRRVLSGVAECFDVLTCMYNCMIGGLALPNAPPCLAKGVSTDEINKPSIRAVVVLITFTHNSIQDIDL